MADLLARSNNNNVSWFCLWALLIVVCIGDKPGICTAESLSCFDVQASQIRYPQLFWLLQMQSAKPEDIP